MTRFAPRIVAAIGLLAFLALAIGDVVATSPTVDEPVHLAAGISYWRTGDFRLNPEHPPLVKLIGGAAAASAAGMPQGDVWSRTLTDPMAQWSYARDLFPNPDRVFTRARLALLVFPLLLGALIYLWSNELWGAWGAALSTLLFAFDPNFIAHGGLVTTDVPVAALMFAALYFFWRVCNEAKAANIAGFALFFALALTAKYSAVLLLPMVLVLALIYGRRKAVFAAIGIAILASVLAIWAAYGFRRAATPEAPRPIAIVVDDWYATRALLPRYPQGPPDIEVRRARATTRRGLLGRGILMANDARLLPEAYLHGFALVQRSSIVRNGFLNGEHSNRGFRSYFFWTILYKTPIPHLILIIAGLILGRRGFLLTPVLIYLAVSIFTALNIGHRHILPIYPFLYVMAGAVAVRWKRPALVAAVVLIIPAMLTWSRHLAYMNVLAGPRPWEKLVDSNFDWGQDLERLAKKTKGPLNLVYFGSADPRSYGIDYTNLTFGYWAEPAVSPDSLQLPATIAISASALEGLTATDGYREYWQRWLAERNAKLVDRAGDSILIYRVGG